MPDVTGFIAKRNFKNAFECWMGEGRGWGVRVLDGLGPGGG